MKKFSKIMAASLALALAFGMTVSAAPSGGSSDGVKQALQEQANGVNSSIKAPEGVVAYATAVTEGAYNNVLDKVADSATSQKAAAALKLSGAKVLPPLLVIDLHSDKENVELTFAVPGAATGKRYALLHMNADGSVKEVLPATCAADGTITATFTTFSIYAVVEIEEVGDNGPAESPAPAPSDNTSPKTGETMPVAGIMALLLLAGAVVCAKKVRFNH